MDLADLMQGASTPMAPAGSLLGGFHRNVASLYLSGMFALANGYLLTSIAFASMLVHVIDGKFHLAALWLTLCAVASSIGIIHAPKLDPYTANQLFPAMYLVAAAIALCTHALVNRTEQMREFQIRFVQKLVRLDEYLPRATCRVCIAPVHALIERLATRLGILFHPTSYFHPASSAPADAADSGSSRTLSSATPRAMGREGQIPSSSSLFALGLETHFSELAVASRFDDDSIRSEDFDGWPLSPYAHSPSGSTHSPSAHAHTPAAHTPTSAHAHTPSSCCSREGGGGGGFSTPPSSTSRRGQALAGRGFARAIGGRLFAASAADANAAEVDAKAEPLLQAQHPI